MSQKPRSSKRLSHVKAGGGGPSKPFGEEQIEVEIITKASPPSATPYPQIKAPAALANEAEQDELQAPISLGKKRKHKAQDAIQSTPATSNKRTRGMITSNDSRQEALETEILNASQSHDTSTKTSTQVSKASVLSNHDLKAIMKKIATTKSRLAREKDVKIEALQVLMNNLTQGTQLSDKPDSLKYVENLVKQHESKFKSSEQEYQDLLDEQENRVQVLLKQLNDALETSNKKNHRYKSDLRDLVDSHNSETKHWQDIQQKDRKKHQAEISRVKAQVRDLKDALKQAEDKLYDQRDLLDEMHRVNLSKSGTLPTREDARIRNDLNELNLHINAWCNLYIATTFELPLQNPSNVKEEWAKFGSLDENGHPTCFQHGKFKRKSWLFVHAWLAYKIHILVFENPFWFMNNRVNLAKARSTDKGKESENDVFNAQPEDWKRLYLLFAQTYGLDCQKFNTWRSYTLQLLAPLPEPNEDELMSEIRKDTEGSREQESVLLADKLCTDLRDYLKEEVHLNPQMKQEMLKGLVEILKTAGNLSFEMWTQYSPVQSHWLNDLPQSFSSTERTLRIHNMQLNLVDEDPAAVDGYPIILVWQPVITFLGRSSGDDYAVRRGIQQAIVYVDDRALDQDLIEN